MAAFIALRITGAATFENPLGVPRSQAIALGLLLYLLNLVVSLFGAPAFAVGNRTKTVTA